MDPVDNSAVRLVMECSPGIGSVPRMDGPGRDIDCEMADGLRCDIAIHKYGHEYTDIYLISAQMNITSIQALTQQYTK